MTHTKKMEIKVPWDFESDKEQGVPIARFYGKNGTYRVFFVMSTMEIHMSEPNPEGVMLGLGNLPRKEGDQV